jgi:tetratricopeptide (TPR) repeat protein
VYEESLSHATAAVSMDPDNYAGYDVQADALFGLRRFQECINAAKQAVRLSDGKYGWLHFRLGAAYFETQNWEFARQSFERAAALDLKGPSAAYNLALCFERLGYKTDAARWFQEVLRRDPNSPDKDEIQRKLEQLRR